MKLTACIVAGGPTTPLYQLKDAHTGIVYPNLLTSEQINSPAVQEAARTYIGMLHIEQLRANLAADSPLAAHLFDFVGWVGSRSGRTCASKPAADAESAVTVGERRLLLDRIEQLQRANAGLQERNDRQARIIQAVQGAVRGDVQ